MPKKPLPTNGSIRTANHQAAIQADMKATSSHITAMNAQAANRNAMILAQKKADSAGHGSYGVVTSSSPTTGAMAIGVHRQAVVQADKKTTSGNITVANTWNANRQAAIQLDKKMSSARPTPSGGAASGTPSLEARANQAAAESNDPMGDYHRVINGGVPAGANNAQRAADIPRPGKYGYGTSVKSVYESDGQSHRITVGSDHRTVISDTVTRDRSLRPPVAGTSIDQQSLAAAKQVIGAASIETGIAQSQNKTMYIPIAGSAPKSSGIPTIRQS